MKELQMMDVLREIIFYLMFLWVLMVVSYSLRDPNAYHIKEHLTDVFVKGSGADAVDFTTVCHLCITMYLSHDSIVTPYCSPRLMT